MKSEEDWDVAILNVRRAYRMAALYQRRLLDLLRLTTDAFGDHRFLQWQNAHLKQPPGIKTNPLAGRFSWDFLPLHSFTLQLVPSATDGKVIQPGETMIEIYVTADSELETPEPNQSGQKDDPDPSDWVAPEQAESTISIFCWHYKGQRPWEITWEAAWSKVSDYPEDEGEVTSARENDDLVCTFLEWPMSEFMAADDPKPFVERIRHEAAVKLGAKI